jgi:hypothetical protein
MDTAVIARRAIRIQRSRRVDSGDVEAISAPDDDVAFNKRGVPLRVQSKKSPGICLQRKTPSVGN